MKQFFSRLSYSFGNEDWQTERAALRIQSNDRILCVTASGDRPLNLLYNECREIVAIDLNPIQNYLLSLKMAAMEHLDYEDYIAFLGVKPCKDRKRYLEHITPYMPPQAAAHWHSKLKMIEKGVLYQGNIERLTKKVAVTMGLCRKKKIDKLFQFDDINAQKEFVENEWENYAWRKVFDIGLHPIFNRLLWKDPGLYDYLGPTMQPGEYIYQRIHNSLCNHLAKENLILSFILLGCVKEEAFPPYLTREGTDIIRPRLKNISIREHDIVNFLEKEPDNRYDCFSISDVASYLSASDFPRLLNAIYRTARPRARFCLREFMSSHTIPEHLQSHFCREPELEKRLEAEDRTIFYRFLVGAMQK